MSHLLQSCVAQVVVLPRPEARVRRFEFPYARFFAAGEEGRRTAALFARRSLGYACMAARRWMGNDSNEASQCN